MQGFWGANTTGEYVAQELSPAESGGEGEPPGMIERFIPPMPEFPAVVVTIDRTARRLPWYVWLGIGMFAAYQLDKRFGRRKGGSE